MKKLTFRSFQMPAETTEVRFGEFFGRRQRKRRGRGLFVWSCLWRDAYFETELDVWTLLWGRKLMCRFSRRESEVHLRGT